MNLILNNDFSLPRPSIKVFFMVTILFIVVIGDPQNSIIKEWEKYKLKYLKSYATKEEDSLRLDAYVKWKQMVEEHNEKYRRGESSYEMRTNHFSDWFPAELKKLTGLKSNELESMTKPFGRTQPRNFNENPPISLNWMEKGAVTEVKDQGNCGSCYAFSAVGALEGYHFLKKHELIELSEQNLLDCSFKNGNDGCDGGLMHYCFEYVADVGGIDTEASYPYEAEEEECRFKKSKIGASCTGFEFVTPSENEDVLKKAVATIGPISIGFSASQSFLAYHKGIYDGFDCSNDINHGMLLVGYGYDNETDNDYWLIKNSWGPSWGEKGYVKVLRGYNICGLANYGVYPV